MSRTACTEPQCLYKGDLYQFIFNCIADVQYHDLIFVTIPQYGVELIS